MGGKAWDYETLKFLLFVTSVILKGLERSYKNCRAISRNERKG